MATQISNKDIQKVKGLLTMADDIVKAVEACRAGVVSAPAIIHVADDSAS
jgi:hypothetical protein